MLKEIGILGSGNETYEKANRSKEEIVDDNREYSDRLGYELTEKEKELPTMYWIPKMHIGSLLLRNPVAPNNFQQQYQIHLSLYIVKLKISIGIVNLMQTITSFGSFKSLILY